MNSNYYKIEDTSTQTVSVPICLYDEMDKVTRYVLILSGIPFYQSSGNNSSSPGTWFPFRGLDPEDGWLKKPLSHLYDSWPIELHNFINENKLNTFEVNRFGSLSTMCISAILGGGYWRTKEGDILYDYLQKYYQSCFFMNKIKIDFSHIKFLYTLQNTNDVKNCNKVLSNVCQTLIPINVKDSRLPTHTEHALMVTLFAYSNDTLQIIRSLLKDDKVLLDRNLYDAVISLCDTNLLTQAIDLKIFDAAKKYETIQKLIKLFENKNKDITVDDLFQISPFQHIIEIDPEYLLLIKQAPISKLLVRCQKNNIEINQSFLELIKKCHKEKFFSCIKYLHHLKFRQTIISIFKLNLEQIFEERYISLVVSAKEQGLFLLMLHLNVFNDFEKIKVLMGFTKINQSLVYNVDTLVQFPDLLKSTKARNIIFELSLSGKLDKNILSIINEMFEKNLLIKYKNDFKNELFIDYLAKIDVVDCNSLISLTQHVFRIQLNIFSINKSSSKMPTMNSKKEYPSKKYN